MKHIYGLFIVFVILYIQLSFAQIPQTMSYQGIFTDNQGQIVADGNYLMIFRIYNQEAEGTVLWEETQSVAVSNGIFNVILGSDNPLSLNFDQPYWLGSVIDSGDELIPRVELTASPYSLNAEQIMGTNLIPSDGNVGLGIVNPEEKLVVVGTIHSTTGGFKFPDGTTQSSAMVTPSMVASIDGVSNDGGNIDLVEGSNITITPDDANNRITISSSGGTSGGDITAVAAGAGLTGGGETADVALNVGAGDGIIVTADAVSINTEYTDPRYVNEDQANSVTAAMVTPNVLSSVDGVSNDAGNVDLIAGSNVTITPNDGSNSITISASAGSADNLGNHIATQNIRLNGNWLSADGGNEGVYVNNSGNVGIGTPDPGIVKLRIVGGDETAIEASSTGGNAIYATSSAYDAIYAYANCGGGDAAGDFTASEYGTYGIWAQSNDYDAIYVSSGGGYAIHATSSGTDYYTDVIHAEYNNSSGSQMATAVYGKSKPEDHSGIGGHFEGGFIGVEAVVEPDNNPGAEYIGITSDVNGGNSWMNKGIECNATGPSDYNIAIEANASGSGSTNRAVAARSDDGVAVYAQSASGWAGIFDGDVNITGTLSKGGGSFKIDHPLDPLNKNLLHSFVESPDMMNIYNGNVITDSNGDATVDLPEWFEALNKDFRYQLTVIGEFAQAIISQKITNNKFSIKTDKPTIEVSWQITGTRQDAFANANRIPVEEMKDADERGKYLHPQSYGMPQTMSVDYDEELEQRRIDRQNQKTEHKRQRSIEDQRRSEERIRLENERNVGQERINTNR